LEEDSEVGFLSHIKSFLKRATRRDQAADDLSNELHELMHEGMAKGLITNEESEMVDAVLDLRDKKVHSVMIPRTEGWFASANATLGEIIELVTKCGHTRIPIYGKNIDDIVGILHAKDLLRLWGSERNTPLPSSILRKPHFVVESQDLSAVFKELKEAKTHLAIVMDEYGGTAGIITVEDIIEEIVGEIMDEHDQEEPMIIMNEDGTILVDARLEVEKLAEYLNADLPSGDFESVGGLIIHLLGRIPQPLEIVTLNDLHFKVQKADNRRIHKILISRTA
jgi:magnesium and cobalt transporter